MFKYLSKITSPFGARKSLTITMKNKNDMLCMHEDRHPKAQYVDIEWHSRYEEYVFRIFETIQN